MRGEAESATTGHVGARPPSVRRHARPSAHVEGDGATKKRLRSLRVSRDASHNDSSGESSTEDADVALKQLTLRGFDKELERRLRNDARADGVSLNRAALTLIRRGAGLDSAVPSNAVGSGLDHLIGTWSESDERSLRRATAVFERVDEDFWR